VGLRERDLTRKMRAPGIKFRGLGMNHLNRVPEKKMKEKLAEENREGGKSL